MYVICISPQFKIILINKKVGRRSPKVSPLLNFNGLVQVPSGKAVLVFSHGSKSSLAPRPLQHGHCQLFLHHDLGMATGDGNGRNGHSACSATKGCSYPGTLETLENGHEVTSGCRCRSLWTLPPETAKLFSLSSPIPLPNLKMTPNITGWPTYFSETAVLQKH